MFVALDSEFRKHHTMAKIIVHNLLKYIIN